MEGNGIYGDTLAVGLGKAEIGVPPLTLEGKEEGEEESLISSIHGVSPVAVDADNIHQSLTNLSRQERTQTQECRVVDRKNFNGNNYTEDFCSNHGRGKYFYYDFPHHEETGVWIPVSVPPMSESTHAERNKSFIDNGGYFPDGDMGWDQLNGEEKELTMWDVVREMLVVARGKMSTLASGDLQNYRASWLSNHILHQAWKEMAETLTETNLNNVNEVLEAEPPKWLPDSSASSCMLCSIRFHPIMCSRHHCRFCGGLFCGECSRGKSLLPLKFRMNDPQRVCDVCCVRLEAVQPYLADKISHAAQLATHDLTDLSTLRSWVNFPWAQSMEYEIYKATNTIRGYCKVGRMSPERSIPDNILKRAKGLAILTVVKVGMMVTYKVGTGL